MCSGFTRTWHCGLCSEWWAHRETGVSTLGEGLPSNIRLAQMSGMRPAASVVHETEMHALQLESWWHLEGCAPFLFHGTRVFGFIPSVSVHDRELAYMWLVPTSHQIGEPSSKYQDLIIFRAKCSRVCVLRKDTWSDLTWIFAQNQNNDLQKICP